MSDQPTNSNASPFDEAGEALLKAYDALTALQRKPEAGGYRVSSMVGAAIANVLSAITVTKSAQKDSARRQRPAVPASK